MYRVNINSYASVFALPTQVTDKHLKLAGSVQLKVLLWAFRHPEKEIDTQEISASLGISKADICDAMQYWIECGFIAENGKEIQIETTESKKKFAVNSDELKAEILSQASITPAITEVPNYKPTQEQIAARIEESAQVRSLFFEMQRIFGRAIGFDTQATILYLLDYGGLPEEVIIMLCEYMVTNGQKGIRAIERVGMTWAEKEINTFDKASLQIERLENTSVIWKELKVLMGLENDKPTTTQKNYLDIWTNEYNFGTDLIFYAYEKMMDKTGKLNFKYMNTILTDWYKKGLKTVEAIEQNDNEYRSKINEAKTKTESSSKTYSTPPTNSAPASYDINKAFNQTKIPTKTKRGQ